MHNFDSQFRNNLDSDHYYSFMRVSKKNWDSNINNGKRFSFSTRSNVCGSR